MNMAPLTPWAWQRTTGTLRIRQEWSGSKRITETRRVLIGKSLPGFRRWLSYLSMATTGTKTFESQQRE